MNLALYRSMMKTHARTLFGYVSGIVLYQWLVIWIFPTIADNPNINELINSMPEGMRKAFGIEGGLNELTDYLANEFYGLLFVLILMIYSVMTAIQLVARLIDRGSMSYMLATSVSRSQVAVTQALVLISGLLLIALSSTVGGIAGVEWFVPERHTFETAAFVQINLMGMLLFLVIGGYSFLLSCLFNDEKRALAAAAGLTVLFYAADLVGKLSSDLDWLQNVTVFTLYRPAEIAQGTVEILQTAIGLAIAAVLLFVGSVTVFQKRDLPL